VLVDRTAILERALQALRHSGTAAAGDILRSEYPFVPVTREARRYTEQQSLEIFIRDGFVDRYSGQRLIFPGILRLLSRLMPEDFPFQTNWKMAETHQAYWELFPTIDHVQPVARGGVDAKVNWVTTSMLRNAAKANWTLEELGWNLLPSGSLNDWDGLTRLFLKLMEAQPSLLEHRYLRRWHVAVVRVGAFT
jgi:hypothetical protein